MSQEPLTEQPPGELPSGASVSDGPSRRPLRRFVLLLSPADQPFWARPVLLLLAGISAFLYAWRASGYLEIYYAAAVRSMSMSWHNFLYAAFDPIGSVSTDKLPGAFWVQALSVRLFGLHDWAIALPQIVEGALTVLVLYRVVRRLAGPIAGIAAAAVLVAAPANVTLDRGNISDTLMILLVVLAADATVSAAFSGHIRHVVFAAIWVGLAFQAKMLEAWLVLPAIGLVYLVAAPVRLRKRILGLGVLAVLTAAVSLSWMLYVTAQPKAGRPYVDGSHNDSIFQQVFEYNGFGRLNQPSPNEVLFETIGLGKLPSTSEGWNRMLVGPFGEDTGWLIPASVTALAFGLFARRRRPRGDPLRASLLLWGTWFAALVAVFSVSTTINSYYVAALTPAIAGLLATGLVIAWERRSSVTCRVLVAATVLTTAIYGAWLLPAHGIGASSFIGPIALAAGSAAALATLLSIFVRWRPAFAAVLTLAVASALVIPTVASGTAVANRLGSFDTPFESPADANATRLLSGPTIRVSAAKLLPGLVKLQHQFHTRYLMATQTAVLAAPTIFVSGREVYPLGGYNGTGAAPSLSSLKRLVAQDDFRIVLASPSSTDPRYRWIERTCHRVSALVAVHGIVIYFCANAVSRPARPGSSRRR
jgi:4-amino-4-deoxy-L-arabinose transferase-like glycosyltransferase